MNRRGFLLSIATGISGGATGNPLSDSAHRRMPMPTWLGPEAREILALYMRGLNEAQIARELHLSEYAVRAFMRNIVAALYGHSRLKAMRMNRPTANLPRL